MEIPLIIRDTVRHDYDEDGAGSDRVEVSVVALSVVALGIGSDTTDNAGSDGAGTLAVSDTTGTLAVSDTTGSDTTGSDTIGSDTTGTLALSDGTGSDMTGTLALSVTTGTGASCFTTIGSFGEIGHWTSNGFGCCVKSRKA